MPAKRPFWATSDEDAADVSLAKDAELDALDKATREQLAAIWTMRAGMELHVGAGFAVITRELVETGAHLSVLSSCARAVEDEVAHAEICLALAKRLHGREASLPTPEPVFIPSHEGASGATLTALHMVAMCCLNETIASVRLGAAIEACTSPITQRALRAILSDEVLHARAGWAHLSSSYVTSAIKSAVTRELPAMLLASVRGLVDENKAIPPAGFANLGLPSITETRAVVEAALRDVVFPGFETVGIPTTAAREHVAHAWTLVRAAGGKALDQAPTAATSTLAGTTGTTMSNVSSAMYSGWS